MYKCLECGHIFDAGEESIYYEKHGLDTPPYEKFSACPVCGGDFEETYRCKKCLGEYIEEELWDGYCGECLRDAMDYNTLLAYLKKWDELADFVFTHIFRCAVPASGVDGNERLEQMLLEQYNKYAEKDSKEFRMICKKYLVVEAEYYMDFVKSKEGK